jgi:uncharacterized Zn-finger protein
VWTNKAHDADNERFVGSGDASVQCRAVLVPAAFPAVWLELPASSYGRWPMHDRPHAGSLSERELGSNRNLANEANAKNFARDRLVLRRLRSLV